jgi:[acyl-carrier-protein] S-malonyltransferase
VSVAFLFPGQASPLAANGRDLAREVEPCRAFVELAARTLGLDADRLWQQGGRLLERTDVYQPVLVAILLGVHEALRNADVLPDAVAGHSLGELAAWTAAGALDGESAIELAAARGRLMHEHARAHPGGLIALRLSDPAELPVLLADCGGSAHLAAHNSPLEYVIGGSDDVLRTLARHRSGVRLDTEGAWHGPALAAAADAFGAALARVRVRPLDRRLVSSVSGRSEGSDAMRDLLRRQLTTPVRWTDALESLRRDGVTTLVTIGPSRVLRALVRQNGFGPAVVHAADSPAALRDVIAALSHAS